ncbi:MAG TPA: hypothetical protein VJZ92_05295 [Thermodesulfobacteriota bacterium]|nr:hypothetical protein [Thermodesulfobacteriota bacterium]
MKQTITIIYFTDNAGKARTVEFSLKSLALLIVGLFILILVSITTAIFSFKLYIEKGRLTDELASANMEKKSLEERFKDMGAKTASTDKGAVNNENEKKTELISLHDFQIKKDGGNLAVSFDMAKTNSAGETLHGYVFIVGDYGGTYICFPEDVEVKDGFPVDFKKGDKFTIKWQKHIERIFPSFNGNAIKMVSIFVYSADGDLLIKKEAGL